jgi:hypothetical protein
MSRKDSFETVAYSRTLEKFRELQAGIKECIQMRESLERSVVTASIMDEYTGNQLMLHDEFLLTTYKLLKPIARAIDAIRREVLYQESAAAPDEETTDSAATIEATSVSRDI